MKLERSKNTARNYLFGTITKVYDLLIPFLMRTLLIYFLGNKYAGLNGLFSSVLSVLNLAELGVGSALVFSMYKPLADDDTKKICALMQLYKIYYRIIGIVILVIGVALTPALPYLINDELPPGANLYVLYYLNLGATVITYWLFAYKNCLINVHQRNDISDKIGYVVKTIKYILQILVLVLFKNYYLYLIVMLVMEAVSNIVTSVVVSKKYPQFHAGGTIPKEEKRVINKRVRDLFTSKIGGIVSNSADTIVISAFLNLTTLTFFQNYYFIMNAVLGFVTLITVSSRSGIGNSIITETDEKNYNDLKKLTLMFAWIGIFCTCCLACLYQPFMELWQGKDSLLEFSIVISFCIYFFTMEMHALLCAYKDASGMWHSDRFRPLITSLSNLAMNLLTVKFLGLYGVIMSTVFSVIFIGMPWLIRNLFKTVFHRKSGAYVVSLLCYAGLAISLTAACIFVSHYLTFDSILLTLFLRGIICILIPNAVMFIIYRKSGEFKELMRTLMSITKGKIKFLERFV